MRNDYDKLKTEDFQIINHLVDRLIKEDNFGDMIRLLSVWSKAQWLDGWRQGVLENLGKEEDE